LKQLQLIQILRINARGAAPAADRRAKARRVNRVLQALRHGKGGIRGTDAAFEVGKTGILGGWRFTAR
jgi:hypothetical protein